MGMIGRFIAVDAEAIEQFQADESLLDTFLSECFESDASGKMGVDVDKAWHCIHFMLNGTEDGGTPPLAWAILGGEECGEDEGYGPPRLLTAQQVQSIAGALPSDAEFAARYNPLMMRANSIYLGDACIRNVGEMREYIVHHYRNLVTFYREAAQRGAGAVLLVY